MTDIIKQRYDGDVQRKDCFLCCVAMAAWLSYEGIFIRLTDELQAIVRSRGPKGEDECDVIMQAGGFYREADYRTIFLLPEFASTGFLKNMLWGRRALVQVRSLNYMDEQHLLFWDGAEVFDPSNARTWKWRDVEPVYLWLFNERRK